MKSQHSTDSMFYSKQPLPRVFCALPPIVPTSCVKTLAMWMYCLYWFNHPDFFRCFLAWKSTFNWLYVLLQAASSSRLLCSSSNRAYIMRQDSGNVDVLSLLIQPPRLSSMFFGMKSQHSTDSMFYSKQPLPRVFCALPPIVPTSCVKTLTMWMYCLNWFNHPDSLRCFLAWQANIQLILCSTPSSLFLASSVLFLQSCLHHASRLWQRGCIVCIDSTTQTLFAVFWHEKSTFNWLYVLLQAASSSRLLCSSSSFASWCAKTVAIWMYCLYWFNHPDSLRCFLAWKVNIQLTLCSTLAASFSRLLCSSSNRAYIMRKDSDNVDVLSELIQPPRLSSLFFGMKSQHSTDSMFYSKQPLPLVFCALPPVSPTWRAKTVAIWM